MGHRIVIIYYLPKCSAKTRLCVQEGRPLTTMHVMGKVGLLLAYVAVDVVEV